jgi:hypothetical protein
MRKKRKPSRSRRTSKFRSGFEAKTANYLRRLGIEFEYESLKVSYMREATYTPDFILPNGIIIETKGLWTSEDRTKHLLIKEQHPVRKGSKTTYAMWCEKKGLKYCDKTIPKSWLNTKKCTRRVRHVDQVTPDVNT